MRERGNIVEEFDLRFDRDVRAVDNRQVIAGAGIVQIGHDVFVKSDKIFLGVVVFLDDAHVLWQLAAEFLDFAAAVAADIVFDARND